MKATVLFDSEALMHRLVRVSAFGAILWHMLAGCCMHHVHADFICNCEPSQAIERALACDCHRDDHDHRQHDAPRDPHQQHDHGQCDQQNCSFLVRNSQTSLEPDLTVSPLGYIALAECAGLHTRRAVWRDHFLGHSPPIPTDRLNAVLQVFLL